MKTILLTLILLAAGAPARAALYDCATELGESVPLKLGEVAWNEGARGLPGRSSVKKHTYAGVLLETRYLSRSGPAFQFELECREKCGGRLVGGEPLSFGALPLYDARVPGAFGTVSIAPARRAGFGLIVRVCKSAVPLVGGGLLPVSASGEHHFFREEEEFVLDVGADEYLFIFDGVYHRLAALEVKICCKRTESRTP